MRCPWLAGVLCFAAPVCAQSAKQAKKYVEMIYAHEAVATASTFDFTQVLTPSLAALVAADANAGAAAKLTVDPFCDCENSGGLAAEVGEATLSGKTHATVSTAIHLRCGSRRHIGIDLVWDKGWRVDDIHTDDVPSLRTLLSVR